MAALKGEEEERTGAFPCVTDSERLKPWRSPEAAGLEGDAGEHLRTQSLIVYTVGFLHNIRLSLCNENEIMLN